MALNDLVNIVDNSRQVLDAFNKQVYKGLNAIGLKAEKHAKENCPVDTGRLRNSLTYATAKDHDSGEGPAIPDDYGLRGQPEAHAVYIGTNVSYAAVQEYHDMAHKVGRAHFLRDAATAHSEEYEKTMEAALKS